MDLTKLLDDLAFIQKLGDNPNTDDGLTAAELKAWFDKAPVAIQDYINETLIPELETKLGKPIEDLQDTISEIKIGSGFLPTKGGTMSGNISMGGNKVTGLGTPTEDSDAVPKSYAVHMTEKTASLPASGWSGLNQSVSVAGVTSSSTVIVTPAPESYTACLESGVYCSGQGAGNLTFTCSTVPSVSVTYNILILE